MPTDSRTDTRRFWVMNAGRPDGPFDVQKIHEMLTSGVIGWQAQACLVGESKWTPLIETPGVGPTAIPVASIVAGKPPALPSGHVSSAVGAERPGPAPVLAAEASSHFETSTKRAWNPMLIACLGVLFTPIWSGVMAAVNGKRLQSGVSPWLPLGIGFGYLVADYGSGMLGSPLVFWVIYFAALLALWLTVLRPQSGLFEQWAKKPGTRSGSWVWPSVAGTPLAVLMILGLLLTPEPREVCDNFIHARTVEQLAECTTQNLRSSLWIFADPLYTKGNAKWELTDELQDPEFGEHYVGFRLFTDSGPHRRTEGAFGLVSWSGGWQIEEIFIRSQDGRDYEPWAQLSQNTSLLAGDRRPPTAPATPQPQQPAPPKNGTNATPAVAQKPWYQDTKVQKAALKGTGAVLKSDAANRTAKAAVDQTKRTAKAAYIGLLAFFLAVAKFGKQTCQAVGLIPKDEAAKS